MTVAALGASNGVVQLELLPGAAVAGQGVPLLVSFALQACAQLRLLAAAALRPQ